MDVDNLREIGGMVKSGARTAWKVVVHVVVAYSILLGLFVLVALGALHVVGVDTGFPSQFKPLTIIFGYLTAAFLNPAEMLRQWLASRRETIIHALDPENGDTGKYTLTPSVREELGARAVYRDDDGELKTVERDVDYLHRIDIETEDGVEEGLECEYYDTEANVAYVSHYGGVSGTELRREMTNVDESKTDAVQYLKERASVQEDWYQNLKTNFAQFVENATRGEVNYVLNKIQGETLPDRTPLRDRVKQMSGESEVQEIVDGEKRPGDELEAENPFESERLSAQLTVEGGSDD